MEYLVAVLADRSERPSLNESDEGADNAHAQDAGHLNRAESAESTLTVHARIVPLSLLMVENDTGVTLERKLLTFTPPS